MNIVYALCSHCKIRRVKRPSQWLCSRACANASRARPLAERFLDYYHPGKPDACWPWTGPIHHNGYGVITDDNLRQVQAHRVAYEHARGPIPKGLNVCHTCDNRPCCNPAHLFVGSDGDNMRDRDQKGRQAKGKAIPQAKLTEAEVRDIRFLYPKMSQQALANKYGVNQTIISDVVRRRTWKHVQDLPDISGPFSGFWKGPFAIISRSR